MQVKRSKLPSNTTSRRGCALKFGVVAALLLGTVYYYTDGLDAIVNPDDDDHYDEFKWEFKTQMPSQQQPLKGILMVAHGCQHSMTDWFPKSSSCRTCLGLPEELAIVELALQRQLLVVAVSSYNRSSKCWSNIDGPRVAELLLKLQTEHSPSKSNKKLPLYAFGASSGGTFVSRVLPLALKEAGGTLSGFVSQIMAVPLAKDAPRTPAVYITMNGDAYTDTNAKSNCQELVARQVPCQQIRLDSLSISKDYFSNRITTISEPVSVQMVEALRQSAFLGEDDNMLLDDPRNSNWRSALQPFADKDSLVADQSPISEVLNVAYAQHEMSRDGVAQAFDFLLEVTK